LDPSLTLHPIGFIRTGKEVKFQTPHQPSENNPEQNVLELLPDRGYETALQDLAGFSRIWLLWWFHRNQTWRPLVLPPRGPARRRGLFATRSPHRPNPLGMTPVPLLRIEGRKLILGACDLVEGTPVFDIKPYIPAYDAFPEAAAGWTDQVEAELSLPAAFTVHLATLAQLQAQWLLDQWQIDFRPRLFELLARDPTPHRTRRIRRRGDTLFVIGCGAWRAVFTVTGPAVEVLSLETGYPPRFLSNLQLEALPDRDAQLAFLRLWPHW
jgi:tRNA-Thr(GGU) m(6)t(6)A37 methyltransferase TsaA